MKRSSGRGRSSRLGVLLSATALVVLPGVAGCSYVSPNTTATTYAAADGTNGEIIDPNTDSGVQLRNFLVVGKEKGGPGTLIGAVLNEGTEPVTVTLTVLDSEGKSLGDAGTVTARPAELTQVGGQGPGTVSVESVTPGTVVQLEARTPAGKAVMSLPVLAAEGHYADVAP
ncbi:MAG: hypothetical protein JNL54_08395 [Kineosporiaceae bacterium]|nr:hypothetical protein [Kineosporiaceae bacterium]